MRKGLFNDDDVEKEMDDIREREVFLNGEIEMINPQLENIPTKEQIKRDANFIRLMIRRSCDTPDRLGEMSFGDKQEILQKVFGGGEDDQGKRLGVYVTKDSKFEINGGIVKNIEGEFPMALDQIQELLNIDPRYEGEDYDPFVKKRTKQSKISKRRGHNIKRKQEVLSPYL